MKTEIYLNNEKGEPISLLIDKKVVEKISNGNIKSIIKYSSGTIDHEIEIVSQDTLETNEINKINSIFLMKKTN